MSDGVIRVCDAHGHELRQIGAHYVCPHGHQCDVDWHVAGSVRKEDLARPQLPAPVIDLTRGEKETPMPPKRQMKPHGTAGRYWQKCRCQPCRDAIREYQRQKREGAATPRPAIARERALPARRRSGAGVSKGVAVKRVIAELVPGGGAVSLSGNMARAVAEIAGLREQLAEAESRFRAEVASFMQGWALVPSHTVIAHALAARRPK